MTPIKRANIMDSLIRLIDAYSPEYIGQSDESSKKIWELIDSIADFEDEVAKEAELDKQKTDTLKEIVSDSQP